MTEHHTDQSTPTPAQVRAARAVTADDRAPRAWKQAAESIGRSALGSMSLNELLHAKGWRPHWGRYLLMHRDSRVAAVPREPEQN